MPLRRPSPRETASDAPEPRPAAALIEALRQAGSASERREAALELAAAPESVGALVAAAGAEAEHSVREAIVFALLTIGTADAASGAARLLASEDAGLRNGAVEALQQMDATAIPAVEPLLGSADPDLRIFAVNVLAGVRDRAARPLLRRVLASDPELNVGLAAVEAVAQVGDGEDAAALRAFAARFPDDPSAACAADLAQRRAGAGDGQ